MGRGQKKKLRNAIPLFAAAACAALLAAGLAVQDGQATAKRSLTAVKAEVEETDATAEEMEAMKSDMDVMSETMYGFIDDVNSHNKVDVIPGSGFKWSRSGDTLTGTLTTKKFLMEGVSRVTKVSVKYGSEMADYDMHPTYALNTKKGILTVTVENAPAGFSSLVVEDVTVFTTGTH